MIRLGLRTLLLLFCVSIIYSSISAQNCPNFALSTPKDNPLYLYFPTASDNTFPEYDPNVQTSPLGAFNVADLDNAIGSTAQLRQRIFEIVTDDYCEFNVEVIMTTTSPSPTATRWQIVGIGTDDETYLGGNLFGVAQAVDINDADGQDYARVYAGSFGNAYGGAGGELNGANSTLERWARAIGHTTTHEAGHNYGLGHGDSAPVAGEDQQNNHIMATGSTGLTGEMRASVIRHFSNTGYEILGHNVGLNVNTVHNWDFVNPNSSDAHSLELTILSKATSLTILWYYQGNRCPWTSPTLSSTGSTRSFQGDVYNEFKMVYSSPKTWVNGSPGVVPAGAELHIGSSFNETDHIIVYEATFFDAGNNELDLHPRLPGYDAGAPDMESGDFELSFFNTQTDRGPFRIQNIELFFLPRLASIESMVDGDSLVDVRGIPIELRRPPKTLEVPRSIDLSDKASIRLASFTDKRHIDLTYDSTDCRESRPRPSGNMDVDTGEVLYCPHGTALSLFPSTSVYVKATIVDPNAKYWDAAAGAFVNGPLESKLFYQIAGFVPDYNNNGIDDLLDIRSGTSEDGNGNGIPDEAEEKPPWWWWLILIIIILILIWLIIWLLRKLFS